MNIAILGAAWGDEGKGHITHNFSKNYDWVVRFNGGANAGHTIYRDDIKYVHNLLPSFDWRYSRPKAYLGSGMVIDLQQLVIEISLLSKSSSLFPQRVYVDHDAFVVLPEYKEEDKLSNSHIGSTNKGIGPAYKSKIGRTGVRIIDIINSSTSSKYASQFKALNDLRDFGINFVSLLSMKSQLINSDILYEGAQGVMLDINHGIYPYVSCSESTVAGIYSAGFYFAPPKKVYGVAKTYTTKVGEGPFPTEIFGDAAEDLRKRGNEYGAVTGRPRKVGWIDLPALNYACQKGGIDSLILTKFDILDGMDRINMCIAYDKPPMSPIDFFGTKPQYISVPGWKNTKDKSYLAEFINIVKKSTNCPVEFISCGTKESDIIRY